jgi:hypothetical protein
MGKRIPFRSLADEIVEQIEADILARKGIGDEWEQIDADLQEAIRREWRLFIIESSCKEPVHNALPKISEEFDRIIEWPNLIDPPEEDDVIDALEALKNDVIELIHSRTQELRREERNHADTIEKLDNVNLAAAEDSKALAHLKEMYEALKWWDDVHLSGYGIQSLDGLWQVYELPIDGHLVAVADHTDRYEAIRLAYLEELNEEAGIPLKVGPRRGEKR